MAQPARFAGADGSNIPTTRLGDANVYQGSVIGNLNTLPQNTNINLTSSDDMLRLWNQTTLQHTVYYSYLEEANVTQPGGPGGATTNTVFQFSVTEWANTQDFYLDLPVVVKCTMPVADIGANAKIPVDPMYVNNPTMAQTWFCRTGNVTGADVASIMRLLATQPFENGFFPDNAVIQLFNSFEVYGGTNNQPLGKSFMMFAPNIANIGLNDRVNDQVAAVDGITGLPMSSVRGRTPVISSIPGGAVRVVGPDTNTATMDSRSYFSLQNNAIALSNFEKVIRMASTSNGAVAAANATAGFNDFTSQTFIISIPLSKISEFFKTNKFMPPEFRFKISMSTFNAGISSYVGFMNSGTIGAPEISVVDFKISLDPTNKPTIRFKSQVLQPALQNALNEKWARNVITYNIETKDTYDFTGTAPYNATINISQQRPLQLEICVRALVAGERVPTAAGLPYVRYIPNQLVPWLDANYNPIRIQKIEVFLSGRPIISWRNDYPGNLDIMKEGWENVVNADYARCIQGNGRQPGQNQGKINNFFNNYQYGSPLIIPLTPNMFWDNGIYPTDQGATQIKLVITTASTTGTATLHPDFALRVYKVYTQQLSVDTNQKVTLTEWPARVLQGGSSSSLSQPPVVPGN